jgi:hypothetical protein
MHPSDLQVATLMKKLATKQFDEVIDWDTCYQLVAGVIARSNLPASQYAPESRFGGFEWTDDDVLAIAGEWFADMLDHEARLIIGQGRTDRHISNTAKQSIRQFIIDRVEGNPRRDLWESYKKALKDYVALLDGDFIKDRRCPDAHFPRQSESRALRQRYYSVPEVRNALAIIAESFPTGWTKDSLFDCLVEWSGASNDKAVSLDIERESGGTASHDLVDEKRSSHPAVFLLGREDALSLLNSFSESERRIIKEYVFPNQLGMITGKVASIRLGIPESTLHDRGSLLWKRIETTEFGDSEAHDPDWRRGIFFEILGE